MLMESPSKGFGKELKSPLFRALQTGGLLKDDHIGGCTLYMNRDKVEAIINSANV